MFGVRYWGSGASDVCPAAGESQTCPARADHFFPLACFAAPELIVLLAALRNYALRVVGSRHVVGALADPLIAAADRRAQVALPLAAVVAHADFAGNLDVARAVSLTAPGVAAADGSAYLTRPLLVLTDGDAAHVVVDGHERGRARPVAGPSIACPHRRPLGAGILGLAADPEARGAVGIVGGHGGIRVGPQTAPHRVGTGRVRDVLPGALRPDSFAETKKPALFPERRASFFGGRSLTI